MYQRSIVAALRNASSRNRLLWFGVLLVVIFFLSVLMVVLRLPAAATALWWPAAGVSAVVAIAGREHRTAVLAGLLVISGLANFVAGTDPWVSLGFGIANAAEAWVVAVIATSGRTESGSLGQRDVGRFLLAVGLGAATAGVLAGSVVAVLEGGDFAATAASVIASHASAILIITPLALVPVSGLKIRNTAETAIQVAALVLTVVAVFRPGQSLPLAFLPFPVLTWAAFRFGINIVVLELILAAGLVSALTFAGGGPFHSAGNGMSGVTVEILQLFILSTGGSMLFLASMQNDLSALLARLAASESLLRGGIVNARAGFLIADDAGHGRLRVLEANPAALKTFELDGVSTSSRDVFLNPPEPLREDLEDLLEGRAQESISDVSLPGGELLEFHLSRIEGGGAGSVIAVQSIDVTENTRMQNALHTALENERISADRLRDLNRQKDDFVSSVSHELRTPITSILGYAVELQDQDLPAPGNKFVDVIVRSAKRLGLLVEDLLEIAQITSGQQRDERVPADLTNLLRECAEELSPMAAGRDIKLELELPTEDIRLHTLPAHISRISTNLVSNALKFSPAGSTVKITARTTGHSAVLEVEDHGPGIPAAEIDLVFDRFYRTASSTAAAIPGTGLGLALVRTMVHQLGGTITLTSDGKTGTTAQVTLPATPGFANGTAETATGNRQGSAV